MADAVDVEVKGLRETVRALEAYGVAIEDLRDAFRDIAGRVVTKAEARVAKVSWDLHNSIRAGNTKNKAVVRAGYAGRVQYAGRNNWGGLGIRASHFLSGPANEDREQNLRDIAESLAALARKHNLDGRNTS